jgi:hypothetical protein
LFQFSQLELAMQRRLLDGQSLGIDFHFFLSIRQIFFALEEEAVAALGDGLQAHRSHFQARLQFRQLELAMQSRLLDGGSLGIDFHFFLFNLCVLNKGHQGD